MNTKNFFEVDFPGTLFPLKTNLLMIQFHHDAIKKYIEKILSDDTADVGDSFLPQTRVHAAKPKNHLRRTIVLDPVASYFLYDIVLRNKAAFNNDIKVSRLSFGYQFDNENLIPVHKSYLEFSEKVKINQQKYGHSISFDIASYFNSIYHHDATNWFASLPAISGADSHAFGRFFREINAGRSVDFLPQGIYPAKMIGSSFLRFVDLSGQIKSAQLLRFMDDIYLFDNDEKTLLNDFYRIQELLGIKALNVNPTKTSVDTVDVSISDVASNIKDELDKIVNLDDLTAMHLGSGADNSEIDIAKNDEFDLVNDDQIMKLLELLIDPRADESDAEKILSILHAHAESITSYIPNLICRFPNIVKQLYKLAGQILDKDELAAKIIELVDSDAYLIEYQLFWIAVIAEDYLSTSKHFGKLILKLYERTAEHKIARAKILEIPNQTFGLKEIRDEILKTGTSDWLAWASAFGTRSLKKAERNHALKYFSKASPLNYLISECVQNLP